MRLLTRDAHEGMAQIAWIGKANGNRRIRLNQLRRLFDMYFQISANGRGITQGLAVFQQHRITPRRCDAFRQRLARARMAQFQRAFRQARQ